MFRIGNENFSFEVFTEDTIANALKNLSTGKASVSNDLPVSIMKEAIDVYCPRLTKIMNDRLKNNSFSDILKNAEKTPCFKKGDNGEKNIDQLESGQIFSKVIERLYIIN